MKNVTIEWKPSFGPIFSIYRGSPLYVFAWLKPSNRTRFKQESAWHSCRETFSVVIKKTLYPEPDCKSRVYLKRLMIAVVRRFDTKADFDAGKAKNTKAMTVGINCVNVIEKYLGWSLSKVKKVEDEELSRNFVDGYVITGSPKWLRSPYLLSLYLLLIRMGDYSDTMSKINSLSDFETVGNLPEFSTIESALSANKSVSFKADGDGRSFKWYKDIFKHIIPVIENVDSLFMRKTLMSNYQDVKPTAGISNFCKGKIGDTKLAEKWQKILTKSVDK